MRRFIFTLVIAVAVLGYADGGVHAAGKALSPVAGWKGASHCTTGWCAGQDFPGTFYIDTWNQTTGAVSGRGEAAGSTATGTYVKGVLHLVQTQPGYSSTGDFTMSADGGALTGTWSDSHGVGGTGLFARIGGPPPTTTTTTTSTTTVPTTVAATSTTTSGGTTTTAAAAGGVTTTITGSAAPGTRTPTTMFPPPSSHRSMFLNIPNPGDALTAKNIAEAAALSMLLMLLIVFPSTLFNHTLDANLDTIRGWFPAFLRVRDEPEGVDPATVKRSFWHTWWGFATFMLIADLLYSLMQPGWGLNRGTAHTLLAFMVGTTVSTITGIVITRTYLRRYGKVSGHMEVEVATLTFAVICVIASRLANFVPGYFYGVIAAYEPSLKPSTEDSGRMRVRSVLVTYSLAIVGWILFSPLRRVANHGGFFTTLPLGLAGGLVMGALEFAVIGLLPLRFLPGAALRTWNQKVWLGAYTTGMFLFTLVLMHPGLVSAPNDHSVAWTIGLALFFALSSVAFWWYFKERAKREEVKAATAAASAAPEATA